jgi:hypothetical protein
MNLWESIHLKQAMEMLEKPLMPVVYFFWVSNDLAGDDLVKIGISIDPERRFKELEQAVNKENNGYPAWLDTFEPLEIKVLGYVQGTQYLETALHKALQSKAVGREWFKYDDDVDSLIDGILCDYCICQNCLEADLRSGSSVPTPIVLRSKLSTPVDK